MSSETVHRVAEVNPGGRVGFEQSLDRDKTVRHLDTCGKSALSKGNQPGPRFSAGVGRKERAQVSGVE